MERACRPSTAAMTSSDAAASKTRMSAGRSSLARAAKASSGPSCCGGAQGRAARRSSGHAQHPWTCARSRAACTSPCTPRGPGRGNNRHGAAGTWLHGLGMRRNRSADSPRAPGSLPSRPFAPRRREACATLSRALTAHLPDGRRPVAPRQALLRGKRLWPPRHAAHQRLADGLHAPLQGRPRRRRRRRRVCGRAVDVHRCGVAAGGGRGLRAGGGVGCAGGCGWVGGEGGGRRGERGCGELGVDGLDEEGRELRVGGAGAGPVREHEGDDTGGVGGHEAFLGLACAGQAEQGQGDVKARGRFQGT